MCALSPNPHIHSFSLVTDAISSKMDELKRGKSLVLEVGHCLIIGWSEKVYCLVEQIAMGSEHAGGRAVSHDDVTPYPVHNLEAS